MTLRMPNLLKPFLAALALLYYGSALAATAAPAPSKAATAQTQKFERGLLWRIEPPTGKPSYLFGTIHTDDPRVTELPPAVQERFNGADTLILELVMDTKAVVDAMSYMMFTDERTLPGVLGVKLYDETRTTLLNYGLPVAGLEKQKPWVAVVTLSMPLPKADGTVLDQTLQLKAIKARKTVEGLETVAEQVGVFDQMPMADQIDLLKHTLKEMPKRDEQLEAMTRAYLARDLRGLMAIVDAQRPKQAGVYDALMQRLLKDRNIRMVERLQSRLKQGNVFIAVGAAHLPGPDGVLPLLERAGYRVSPVY
jgi:uncharacterized protein